MSVKPLNMRIVPSELSVPKLHGYLLSSIGPRPIALASTVDKDGNRNLSPFSFFNVFSANPPIVIFSPARRGRDNTTKHTYENVKEVSEVVINVVNNEIVQQVSLSSTEYEKGVDEFVKSGLTPIDSETIRPARVKESPVQLECVVNDVVELGNQGGAGNLVIAEVKLIHIADDILDDNGRIDQHKIDLVGRMGGNWYTRSVAGLFEVEKPLATKGIGVDHIPEDIRLSPILSGNDLGILGNVEELPEMKDVKAYKKEHLDRMLENVDAESKRTILHEEAKSKISQGKVADAWMTLLAESA